MVTNTHKRTAFAIQSRVFSYLKPEDSSSAVDSLASKWPPLRTGENFSW